MAVAVRSDLVRAVEVALAALALDVRPAQVVGGLVWVLSLEERFLARMSADSLDQSVGLTGFTREALLQRWLRSDGEGFALGEALLQENDLAARQVETLRRARRKRSVRTRSGPGPDHVRTNPGQTPDAVRTPSGHNGENLPATDTKPPENKDLPGPDTVRTEALKPSPDPISGPPPFSPPTTPSISPPTQSLFPEELKREDLGGGERVRDRGMGKGEGGEGRDGPAALPPVLVYPCQGVQRTWGLTRDQVDQWVELYPGLDILAECRRALAWILANPAQKKTASGMARFLVNWFSKSTRYSRPVGGRPSEPPPAPVLNLSPPGISLAEKMAREELDRQTMAARASILPQVATETIKATVRPSTSERPFNANSGAFPAKEETP